MQVADMKPCGGGRAPGELCGALHAACVLVPERAEVIKTRFAERLGSFLCKEIRVVKRYPCEACGEHAAELLETEVGP